MRTTEAHRYFWLARRGPGWCRTILRPGAIHYCINAHAGSKLQHIEAGNTLLLLRNVRSRGESLPQYLGMLAHPLGWAAKNQPRRAAYARKWLKRITKEKD